MSHLLLRFVVLADVASWASGFWAEQNLCERKSAYALLEPSSRLRETTQAPKTGSSLQSMTSPEAHAITIITKRNFQSGAAPLVADEGEEKILEEIEDTRDDDDFIEDDLFF